MPTNEKLIDAKQTEMTDQIADLPVPQNFYSILSADQLARIIDEREKFIKANLRKGKDYGVIPGTRDEFLYKPGAEKLNTFFQLEPEFVILKEVWDQSKPIPFISYIIKCILRKIGTGIKFADCIGSCNSMEAKYRYRWLTKNKLPKNLNPEELHSKQMDGRDGQTYTLYRLENEDVADQSNTILMMAEKRAYVGATRIATMTSDRFAQEDEWAKNSGKPRGTAKTQPSQPAQAKPAMKISLATKTAIVNMIDFAGLDDAEMDRLNKKMDLGNLGEVTEKDLFTEDEGQKMLKYFAFRQKVITVKDALYGHFGGDEEAAQKFAKETLKLSVLNLDKLTGNQLDKLSRAVEDEDRLLSGI